MEEKNVSNVSVGPSFATLLTIVFIVLKLTNVIAWSWWWILSPIWISFAFFLVIVIIVFAIHIILG